MIRALLQSLIGGVALWLMLAILGLDWRVILLVLGMAVVWGAITALLYFLYERGEL